MPLLNDPSDQAREANIKTLVSEGKKPDEAVAIAYEHQRQCARPGATRNSYKQPKEIK